MARLSRSSLQDSLLEVKLSTAPAVPAVRKAVEAWRKADYKGATTGEGQG